MQDISHSTSLYRWVIFGTQDLVGHTLYSSVYPACDFAGDIVRLVVWGLMVGTLTFVGVA